MILRLQIQIDPIRFVSCLFGSRHPDEPRTIEVQNQKGSLQDAQRLRWDGRASGTPIWYESETSDRDEDLGRPTRGSTVFMDCYGSSHFVPPPHLLITPLPDRHSLMATSRPPIRLYAYGGTRIDGETEIEWNSECDEAVILKMKQV